MLRLIRTIADLTVHIMLVLAAALAIGFVLFANSAIHAVPRDDDPADGIVVLTGDGGKRVAEGFRLLQMKRGERLLISGVNPQATDRELAIAQQAPQQLFDCCVDVGREAADTIGNAKETAQWVRLHGFKRIIVVTADFHMIRSLTELRMETPRATFVPHPVRTLNVSGNWWRDKRNLKRLGVEYVKVVFAKIRSAGDWLNPFNDGGK